MKTHDDAYQTQLSASVGSTLLHALLAKGDAELATKCYDMMRDAGSPLPPREVGAVVGLLGRVGRFELAAAWLEDMLRQPAANEEQVRTLTDSLVWRMCSASAPQPALQVRTGRARLASVCLAPGSDAPSAGAGPDEEVRYPSSPPPGEAGASGGQGTAAAAGRSRTAARPRMSTTK